MKLVAPLFITNAEFRSVLAIKNSADRPVRVLASFDSLEGEEVGQRLLDLGPSSTATIDVDSIEMVSHRFAAVGSVSIRTRTGRADGISAWLTIASRNSNGRLSMAEDFQIVDDKPRPVQVASIPAPFSVPVLAVHSLSTLPQSISVACSDAEGQSYQSQMTLPPGMTFLVNACISGKSEGRTYEDILRGDGVRTKGDMNIQIKGGEMQVGVAVWGFSSASEQAGSKLQIAGIEFRKWTPPTAVLVPASEPALSRRNVASSSGKK